MSTLSTDLSELDKVPYFLWNESTTTGELKSILADVHHPLRPLYAARVMREGRVRDVWHFLTPRDVLALWPQVEPHLGRRRKFWRFLLDTWVQLNAI